MKAVVMRKLGDPGVLRVEEVPTPEPGANELLIRVAAASVNPLDTKIRRKHLFYPGAFPAVLGCDGAGTVVATGSGVTRFRKGEAVYFFNRGLGKEPGSYAEYTTVHEEYAAAKPMSLSMAEAAAVPLVLITAWEALRDRVAVKSGETILIHAGAGGVGHLAIQLARNVGARVATTARGAEKAAFVRALGAEQVIDYSREDFAKSARAWTGGVGPDVILDTVGGQTFLQSLEAVREYGRVGTLFSTAMDLSQVASARRRNLVIGYQQATGPMLLGNHEQRRRQRKLLEEAAALFDTGRLKVTASRIFPLDEAASAHTLVEDGHVTGKVVLKMEG